MRTRPPKSPTSRTSDRPSARSCWDPSMTGARGRVSSSVSHAASSVSCSCSWCPGSPWASSREPFCSAASTPVRPYSPHCSSAASSARGTTRPSIPVSPSRVPVLRDSGRVLGLGQRASRRLCAHVRPLHRGYGNMPVSGLLRPRAERAARGGLRIGAWGSFKRGAPYRTGVC